MVEYFELQEVEKNTVNEFIASTSVEVMNSSHVWFSVSEIDERIKENVEFHSRRIIDFLMSNDFIKLRTHEPTYELLEEGKRLFKYGSIEKYYEKQVNLKALNISGDNNIINVARGNVNQANVAINSAHNKHNEQALITSIINITESLKKYSLPNYHHWSFSIKMNGKKISTQSIFSKLNEYINNDFKKQRLSIANGSNRISASSSEIIYKQVFQEDRIVNHIREVGLKLSQNYIQFEFAQYKSRADLLTNMSQDFMPSLVLLFFSRTLFNSEIDIEVSVSVSTNWKLVFMPTPGNPFSVKRSNTSTYQLNPNNRTFSTKITDFENSTLMDFMEEVVEGFAADSPFSNILFLSVDAPEQELMLNYVKQYL